MCIGVPGQIRAIDGNQAKVDVCGIQRDVDLTLVGSCDEPASRVSASGCWSTWVCHEH
jgi:hydrogenase assembly chaperone HypC/HupF